MVMQAFSGEAYPWFFDVLHVHKKTLKFHCSR
jgi:hypothetical protein